MSEHPQPTRAPLDGLVTAVRTLSILRVPGRDATSPARSLGWFPVVGLLLGGALVLMARGLAALPLNVPATGVAVVLLTGGALLTRGLHLDGLADWADAWWGGYSRERILEIMKDTHIGTFGVVALILSTLGKWTCYVQLLHAGGEAWIAASFVLGRTGIVDLAVACPYARTGPGTGEGVVKGARPRHLLVAVSLAAVILLLLPGIAPLHMIAGLVAALLAARLFGLLCRQRIGGVTGDILGAGNEFIELIALTFGMLLL